jgi:hypothetical protein
VMVSYTFNSVIYHYFRWHDIVFKINEFHEINWFDRDETMSTRL